MFRMTSGADVESATTVVVDMHQTSASGSGESVKQRRKQESSSADEKSSPSCNADGSTIPEVGLTISSTITTKPD